MRRWRVLFFAVLLQALVLNCVGDEKPQAAAGETPSAVSGYLSTGGNPEVAVNAAVVAFSGAGLLALYIWNRARQRH